MDFWNRANNDDKNCNCGNGNGKSCNYGNGNKNGFDAQNAYQNMSEKEKKDFENKYNEYSSKSEDELNSELYKEVEKLKKDGKFNVSDFEKIYETAKMFMSPDQADKMRKIIDRLK